MKGRLQALYAQIPDANCQGYCHESCGPIAMSPVEFDILTARGWKPPTKIESCSLLGINLRCTAYEDRPAICRLWGATEKLPCPYGCKPDKYLPEEDSRRILRQIQEMR